MYSINRIIKAIVWLCVGTTAQRRRVLQECARTSASVFGDFPISEDNKLWRQDGEFLEQYKHLSPANPYSQDRKFVLREFVRFTQNIPGALAECGCFEGASAWFMASELPNDPIYLFDSFEGLPPPSDNDTPSNGKSFSWKTGDLTASEKILQKNLEDFSNITVLKGWIPERFNEVAEQPFRFVHIDVDLFQPTLDTLDFFYPRLNCGGVIVLDDYGFTTCPGAYKATTDYMHDKPENIIHLPTGQGIIIKTSPQT